MAVFRVERNKGYTVMSNHHLRNKELSLKAKGLLSQMLSLPEDWDYTLKGLWLATTLEETAPPVLWEMMNCRWDIEENGFHQLKTYYHAKHCYCHAAVETIFNLMIIGFNMRELYLYRRIQRFERSGITRKSVSRIFRDDLLTEKVKQILYQKGG